jgi:hypothetical protein
LSEYQNELIASEISITGHEIVLRFTRVSLTHGPSAISRTEMNRSILGFLLGGRSAIPSAVAQTGFPHMEFPTGIDDDPSTISTFETGLGETHA